MCTCDPGDVRCETIRPFFEGAPAGCQQHSFTQNCGNNFGYESCVQKADQTCRANNCWQWAVDVMAVCPTFYPDMGAYSLPPLEWPCPVLC